MVKSVDEITREDLDNVAYRSKDKIWDKENVSRLSSDLSCDTSRRPDFLFVCLFFPGQLMSPVQTEDSGHQDSVPQWFLCRGQRSVLRPVLEESLRRGRAHCAARPGQC